MRRGGSTSWSRPEYQQSASPDSSDHGIPDPYWDWLTDGFTLDAGEACCSDDSDCGEPVPSGKRSGG